MDEHALLIVDDEGPILSSLKRLLRKEPYKVIAANSGAEALEKLEEHDFQMVMSDQRMPHMTGTELLQKVKEGWPETVRVVLSGYAEADVIVESINQGEVFRFIAKPWNDDGLKMTIKQCFEHYDMTRENKALSDQAARHVIELESLNRKLEGSVEARTRSLAFSQEVLESLPLMVLGISRDEEIVLTNARAREELPPIASIIPGTDMNDVLPADVIAAVRAGFTTPGGEIHRFRWDERPLRARTALLGQTDAPRGCVLLLEDDGDDHDD